MYERGTLLGISSEGFLNWENAFREDLSMFCSRTLYSSTNPYGFSSVGDVEELEWGNIPSVAFGFVVK